MKAEKEMYQQVSPYVLPGLLKGYKLKLRPIFNTSDFTELLTAVSEVTGVDADKIKSSHKGNRAVSMARHIFFYLAYKTTGASLQIVGGWIDRDHTTVMAGIRNVRNWMDTDDDFKKIMKQIEVRIY